ncbi:hypothetical protein T439DRAFT_358672 [Meredithblackwellia eburnea MCA 4105]
MSDIIVAPPLSQGAGYGVVVGLGTLFALGMVGISSILSKRGLSDDNEEFTVAKRSLGTGLTAAGVISSWTWSTTLLSSCGVAYTYGVAGALFYAACNSTQIAIFSNLAIQSKRKAPNAHTFLEILRTILTDYLHTAIILVVIFVFWFKAYATSDAIGSPRKMFDLLVAAQVRNDDAPTFEHSYLTLRSLGALKFAILSILEYTGVVFLDNSFHQKGIAADPAAAVPGYVLGALSWIAMPFTLATTMGLVAVALENTPAFPTFPRRMNASETSAGLVLPYAAQTILGKGGAGAVLVLMFMSCTSAISAQLIGVSTVLSYDVYKTYWRRAASDRELLKASHFAVVGFSLWMAGFASLLHGASIDLGFIYMTGIFTGPALPPLVGTFFSRHQTPLAAGVSIWSGFTGGVVTWLTLANRFSGSVTVSSVGELDPCLYGCLAGISISAFVAILVTLIKPDNYDWKSLAAVRIITEKGDTVDVAFEDPSYSPEKLRRAAYIARGVTLFIFLVVFILWPLPLYGSAYVFSRPFFTGWVIVSLLWAFFAFGSVTILPIIEGRHTLLSILSGGRWGKQAPSHEFSVESSFKNDTPNGSSHYVVEATQ